jgi:ribosomal-protein-alanine N-acetyltransferase
MTRVRHARAADLASLRAIQSTTLAESWPDLLELGVHGEPTLLVAEPDRPLGEGGRPPVGAGIRDPVGYALAVTDEDGATGYLVELAVAPDFQGEGHGSELLATLVELYRTKGIDRLRVTVREVDEGARAFYRSHGFEQRSRLPDHYEDGDGFLLVRELS